MKLLRIIRDEEFVKYRHVTDSGVLAREEREITCHEAPMTAFEEALANLGPVAANILGLGKDYTEGMTVRSLAIKYTKHGSRSVEIGFSKILSATDGNHRMKTPFFYIDEPSDSEQFHRECSPKQVEVIEAFIEEAEKYINGERQQRLLPLTEAEPSDAEELPMEGVK